MIDGLEEGDRLCLVAEPDNPHDPNAVAVYWEGFKLGYVPKRDNVAVASLLARGHVVDAEIEALLDEREIWEPLLIRIYVRTGEQG